MWWQHLTRGHALFGTLLILLGYMLWGPPNQAGRFTDPTRYEVHQTVGRMLDGLPFTELEWRQPCLQEDGTLRCGMCYQFEMLEGPVIRDHDFIIADGRVLAREQTSMALAGY
jgi:hypothetical protein